MQVVSSGWTLKIQQFLHRTQQILYKKGKRRDMDATSNVKVWFNGFITPCCSLPDVLRTVSSRGCPADPVVDPVGGGGGGTAVEWREGMCVGLYTGAMEPPRTFMRLDDAESHLTYPTSPKFYQKITHYRPLHK